jgi:hypothetical protein
VESDEGTGQDRDRDKAQRFCPADSGSESGEGLCTVSVAGKCLWRPGWKNRQTSPQYSFSDKGTFVFFDEAFSPDQYG